MLNLLNKIFVVSLVVAGLLMSIFPAYQIYAQGTGGGWMPRGGKDAVGGAGSGFSGVGNNSTAAAGSALGSGSNSNSAATAGQGLGSAANNHSNTGPCVGVRCANSNNTPCVGVRCGSNNNSTNTHSNANNHSNTNNGGFQPANNNNTNNNTGPCVGVHCGLNNNGGFEEGNSQGNTCSGAGCGSTTGSDFDSVVDTFINPININTFPELVLFVMKGLIFLIGIMAVLIIIIGGVRMVISQGNQESVTKGKQTIIWAVAGLIVALLSFSLVSIIQNLLSKP
jgi:hypothetical protein